VMLAWRPSITNWTASAASNTPRTRESTSAPVSPKSRQSDAEGLEQYVASQGEQEEYEGA
jgi:hypothetical protein